MPTGQRSIAIAAWCVVLTALGAGSWRSFAQGSGSPPAYLEDSPAAGELLEEARQLRAQDRLAQAVALLEQIVETYPHKLISEDGSHYQDAVLTVGQWLMDDPLLLGAYQEMAQPQAQRVLEEAEAASGVAQLAALEKVVERYALTQAGLDAALGLAALDLERADPHAGAQMLDQVQQHPDLSAHRERYHLLQAVAGLMTQDVGRQQHHEAQLEAGGMDDALAQVRAMARHWHPPDQGEGMPVAQWADLPQGPTQPLWSAVMDGAVLPESMETAMRRRVGGRQAAQMSARRLPMWPAAGGDRLYVNDGRRMVALDRNSGRVLWAYEPKGAASASRAMQARGRHFGGLVPEMRSVLVLPTMVVGVVGQETRWPGARVQGQGTDAATRVVALSRADGRLLWSRRTSEVDPSLTRAAFHGTPLAGYGRVCVLMRRSQVSGFRDTFVAALDLKTGQPQWSRHISSTVAANRYTQGPSPAMTMDGARLYVSDNVGVAAALDTRQGQALWVRRLTDADPAQTHISPGQLRYHDRQNDQTSLVRVKAGLLVPMQGHPQQAMLLDPQTGQTKELPEAAVWSKMHDFIFVRGDVLSIGEQITLWDGSNLTPRWSVSLGETKENRVVGKAGLARDCVVLPTQDRLVYLSLADGSTLGQAQVSQVGHTLVLDGQIVLADTTQVHGLLNWGRANANLTQQMKTHPDQVAPGLGLAHLALRTGHDQAVLRGVDHALAAVAVGADAAEQAQVFEDVLAMIRDQAQVPKALRVALFQRLGTATASPNQEATYQLAIAGFWEEVGQIQKAVDHHQAILLDPTLQAQLLWEGTHQRQAGIKAKHHLQRLIQAHGPAIYQRYDTLGAGRLAQLHQRVAAEPESLAQLANMYPFARVAPLALLEAARIRQDRGDFKHAVHDLKRAIPMTDDPAILAQVIGSLVEAYVDDGQPSRAIQWLGRVDREHPGLMPWRDGQPTTAARWLADLAHQASAPAHLPAVRVPLAYQGAVPGRLLTPANAHAMDACLDAFAVRQGTQIHLYHDRLDQPTWAFTVPDMQAGDRLELLSLTDTQIRLWLPSRGQLHTLSTRTGQPIMPTVDAPALLGDWPAEDKLGVEHPVQRQFIEQIDIRQMVVRHGRVVPRVKPAPARYFVAAHEQVIVIADAAGRVAGLDPQTGGMLWKLRSQIHRLEHLVLGDDALTIAGVTAPGTDAAGHVMRLLDPMRGQFRSPMLEENQSPHWLGLTGNGSLIVVGEHRVTAHRVSDGAVLWRRVVPELALTDHCWAGPNLLLVMDRAGVMLVMAPQDGQVMEIAPLPAWPGDAPLNVIRAAHQWQLLQADRAVALSSEGRLLWRDGLSHLSERRQQFITQRHVILGVTDRGDAPLAYDLFVLDRLSGAITSQCRLPIAWPHGPASDLAALALAGRLVLSDGQRTHVVAGSGSSAPQQGD